MKSHTNEEIAAIRDPKWLVVNGVEPKINGSLMVDIISKFGISDKSCFGAFLIDWSTVREYRLHNGPGYKDGIAIDNDTLKADEKKRVAEFMEKKSPIVWNGKGQPRAGVKCEVKNNKLNDAEWEECEVLFIGKFVAVYTSESCVERVGDLNTLGSLFFRPILTPKQRTIEAASVIIHGWQLDDNSSAMRLAENMHDAGMLTLPGESS